jgi:hypothetical protein
MKHYEVIISQKNGVARKGVAGTDIVDAINKAVKSVEGATVADVERVAFMGNIDVQ